MKLPLAYYGNPILRKKARPVDQITDEIRTLVQDMIETMRAHKGIGLAAPQVNRSLRIFITCTPKEEEEEGDLYIYINPQIIACSEQTWTCSEACLSIPKVYSEVSRPETVRIEALDLEGRPFTRDVTELEAHCILHENDHINGVLFIDRLDRKTRKSLNEKLREIKKDEHLKNK